MDLNIKKVHFVNVYKKASFAEPDHVDEKNSFFIVNL